MTTSTSRVDTFIHSLLVTSAAGNCEDTSQDVLLANFLDIQLLMDKGFITGTLSAQALKLPVMRKIEHHLGGYTDLLSHEPERNEGVLELISAFHSRPDFRREVVCTLSQRCFEVFTKKKVENDTTSETALPPI